MKVVFNDGGRKAEGFKGQAGDCVARAISIAAQRSYAQVYFELATIQSRIKKTKRRKKAGVKSARNGVYVKSKLFKDYMAKWGFTWTPTMAIGSGCKVHLADGELPETGRLVVSLSRHYTAVIDGVIHDTYDPQRDKSWSFEQDHGQELKPGQGRNVNGVFTEIGGRCVYGYWTKA